MPIGAITGTQAIVDRSANPTPQPFLINVATAFCLSVCLSTMVRRIKGVNVSSHFSRIIGHAWFVLIMVAAVMFLSGPVAKAEPFIVKDGKPRALIVIAEQPTRMQKLAAQELQKYILKITGADLSIGTQPSDEYPITLYVGSSDHTARLGIETADLAYGAYRIKAGENYLALVGRDDDYFLDKPGDGSRVHAANQKDRTDATNAWHEAHGQMWVSPFTSTFKGYNRELGVWDVDEHGSLNAVNDFLRYLGVRWYMPGDFGEICPRLTSIELPAIDQTVRPEWSQREIHFHSANPYQISAIEMLWQLRLGLRPQEESIGGHGTQMLLGTDWVKQNRPDFFALYGKERATSGQGKPCYSSQGLYDSALGFANLLFSNYDKSIVSLMPTDGYTAFCQCELCQGKDTPERGFAGMMSNYVWEFMNRAAAESAKSHPDRFIMNYAYNTYLLPPDSISQLHPNLRVGICGGRKAFHDPAARKRAMDIREGFLAKIPSGRISLWEYYNLSPGQPAYFTRIIAEDLRYLKGKVDGTMIEYTRKKRVTETDLAPDKTLAVSHLNLWLTTRLWWNPEVEDLWWSRGKDVNQLLDEYYTHFYGPAAPQMKTFIEYCQDNWPTMLNKPEPIDEALALLEKAQAAAGQGDLYAQRVGLVVEELEALKVTRDQLKIGRDGNPSATYTPLKDDQTITLDGKMDEAFWKDLPAYSLKHIDTGQPMANSTTFKLAWKGDSLYVAIRCEEDAMDKLHLPAKADSDNLIFDGDSVEILLETPTHAYYQIAVDAQGHINDLDRPNSILIGKTGRYETRWEAGAQVASYRGKDHWSIEIKIPALGSGQEELLPLFGVSGDQPTHDAPWHFNIGRVRKVDLPEREISAYSPTGEGGFHYMRFFGQLTPP